MDNSLLLKLERTFTKCSDYGLLPEYVILFNKLYDIELSKELVEYLCDKATSKKHIWEIRFDHLRILLLNPSARKFDLKAFYLENLKRSRRLALKLFYIRGYAMYASEEELNPVMEKFCNNMEKIHDYIDYNYILSVAGLPYLADTYGYPCFAEGLETAKREYEKACKIDDKTKKIDVFWNNIDFFVFILLKRQAESLLLYLCWGGIHISYIRIRYRARLLFLSRPHT